MKKILLVASLLLGSSSLFADYELFTSYTKPLSSIKAIKSETVFSGSYEDYAKEVGKNSAITGSIGVLTGAATAGLAGGLIGGAAVLIAFELSDDEQFIQVIKISDVKGNYILKRTLLVSNKNPNLSVSQAINIMKRGK